MNEAFPRRPAGPPGRPGPGGLSRRRFLGLSAGAGVGAAAGGRLAWQALVTERVEEAARSAVPADAATDSTVGATAELGAGATAEAPTTAAPRALPPTDRRVLVVVQLGGGNDGLNTLIPHDGRYMDARPSLRVAEGDLVALRGEPRFGLHPALAGLAPLWDAGRLAAVEGVGFPDQTRSHFEAMDTWWRASPDRTVRTGWLGRWLDQHDDADPLRAIALGGGSPALAGARSLSTVVLDPRGFSLMTPKGADARAIAEAFRATAAPLAPEPTLAAAQLASAAAVDAVESLAAAREAGAGGRGEGGRITERLATAAGIIRLDLGARVLLVAADGFDTHTDQASRHPKLLADLAGGIRRFVDSLDEDQRDRVLLVTTSEFGRRVRENGSGTDHGDGSVQFLLGAGVTGGRVVGEADLARLTDGDLPSAIDSRDVYAMALDWLGADRGATDTALGTHYDRHDLIRT